MFDKASDSIKNSTQTSASIANQHIPSLKIVIAGTPDFALPCFEAIRHSQHTLLAVYTQPDRAAGRGRKLQASAVKNWAMQYHLPIYQPVNFKNPDDYAALIALKPDVLVVIAYGLILPKAILSIPNLGCINVHASLLPRWRGASPIQQAIWHGDVQSGITIMQMDIGMDTGDILQQCICPIEEYATAGTLQTNLAKLAINPLLDTLNTLAMGQVYPKLQDNNFATYAPKIHKQDAAINWQQPAKAIDRQIRAYNPYPIAYTLVGEAIMRIHKAIIEPLTNDKSAIPAIPATPGTVLAIDRTGLLVATSCGALRVQYVQFPGGKIISIADYLNAQRSELFRGVLLGA